MCPKWKGQGCVVSSCSLHSLPWSRWCRSGIGVGGFFQEEHLRCNPLSDLISETGASHELDQESGCSVAYSFTSWASGLLLCYHEAQKTYTFSQALLNSPRDGTPTAAYCDSIRPPLGWEVLDLSNFRPETGRRFEADLDYKGFENHFEFLLPKILLRS